MAQAREKSLIIVESPAKIKTLKKFLGDNYVIESSIGHIRDLPEKGFGIDIDKDFTPTYEVMKDKKSVIDKLVSAAKRCKRVFLSPDPDREGEAIAWHIASLLPKGITILRASFNSLTKEAVLEALNTPREIDLALVDAQQARRLLDRIVGYKISPILNRRMQRGRDAPVSAGRVQSVALKLVVNREKEIEAFVPVEYWNLGAVLEDLKVSAAFKAGLYSVDGRRVEKEAKEGKDFFLIPNKEVADQVKKRIEKESFSVSHVEKKEKRRFPPPPFITSTLQQEASRHLGFSSSRTMAVAQGLYEGVDLGNEEREGLITYMRTDSVRIVPEVLSEARTFIERKYGKPFLPPQPRVFAGKKSAQDAHEAIRPTHVAHVPEEVERYLTKEQFLLYRLIWRRFVASQMKEALYDTVSVDIAGTDQIVLRATGSTLIFKGYLELYQEKMDDDEKDEESRLLPPLQEGQKLLTKEVFSDQSFTKPPPRFTEASLVKELEKSGIGRPSTYVSIMNKIQSRDYTVKESGRLKPTELGRVIADFLEASFCEIMDIGFTADMEDALEAIANNEMNWKEVLRNFWGRFEGTLEKAEKEGFVPRIATDIDCPQCGSKLQKIWFKGRYFYGCTKYPDCNYSAQEEEINFDRSEYREDFDWDQHCPVCQSEMKLRHGRFGAFLGCVRYPECKGIVNIPKKGELSPDELPSCPAIDCPGHLVQRRSRFGKAFFSCSTYPECDVIVNQLEEIDRKYPHHPRTAYVKKAKKGAKGAKGTGKKGSAEKGTAKRGTSKKSTGKKTKDTAAKKSSGFSKVHEISPELQTFLGEKELSRADVTKKIWAYIKEKGLQGKEDKRTIVPDAALAKLLGSKDPFSMFQLSKLLQSHFR